MKARMENCDNVSPFTRTPSPAASAPPHVFLSIQPLHADNILNGRKTVEFRRRFPNADRMLGAIIWIYSSSPVKAVIGVARVEAVDRLPLNKLWSTYHDCGGIDRDTFREYFSGMADGCAIRLAEVTELDNKVPVASLSDIGFHVPQSYRYVTDDVYPLLTDAHGETASRYQCRDQARRS